MSLCLSISPSPNAHRMHKPFHDCSSISTKSASEQLIYTVQQLTSKLQLLQKTICPMAFKMTVQTLPNVSILLPSGQNAFPSWSWSTVSRLSLFPSPLFSFWFMFYWFSLSLHFLYSVFCFRTSQRFLLSDSPLLLRSLAPLLSLVWVGSEPEVFGLHATGMCHSCIVSTCEHTNVIDDLLLMAFWYVIVIFSRDKKGET